MSETVLVDCCVVPTLEVADFRAFERDDGLVRGLILFCLLPPQRQPDRESGAVNNCEFPLGNLARQAQ